MAWERVRSDNSTSTSTRSPAWAMCSAIRCRRAAADSSAPATSCRTARSTVARNVYPVTAWAAPTRSSSNSIVVLLTAILYIFLSVVYIFDDGPSASVRLRPPPTAFPVAGQQIRTCAGPSVVQAFWKIRSGLTGRLGLDLPIGAAWAARIVSYMWTTNAASPHRHRC